MLGSTLLSFYAEEASKRLSLFHSVGGTGWNVIGRSLCLPTTCKIRRDLVTPSRLTFRENSSAEKEKPKEPLSEEVVLPWACMTWLAPPALAFSLF